MTKRRPAPLWLSRVVIDAIHIEQLREHGGLIGLRDEHALESALARPIQKWQYAQKPDIPMFAASYAYGLVRSHPYGDGNKRIGFLAMVTFLGVNNYDFEATDTEVVATFLSLAEGRISEEALADWIRQHSTKRRRPIASS